MFLQEALRRRRRWVEEMKNRIDSGEEDARLDALKPRLDALKTRPDLPQGPDDPEGRVRDKRSIFNYLGQRFGGVRSSVRVFVCFYL